MISLRSQTDSVEVDPSYQLGSATAAELASLTQEDDVHPSRLELLQQILPARLVTIVGVVDDDLPTLTREEIPDLVLYPVFYPFPERLGLFRFLSRFKVVRGDFLCGTKDFTSVVS